MSMCLQFLSPPPAHVVFRVVGEAYCHLFLPAVLENKMLKFFPMKPTPGDPPKRIIFKFFFVRSHVPPPPPSSFVVPAKPKAVVEPKINTTPPLYILSSPSCFHPGVIYWGAKMLCPRLREGVDFFLSGSRAAVVRSEVKVVLCICLSVRPSGRCASA